MWKNFKTKKVWENDNSTNVKNKIFLFTKILIVLICIVWVLFFWKFLVKWGQVALWSIWKGTVKTVSKKFWDDMIKDEYWNVNVLLVWIWWEVHQWWFLSDTMIVVSRNQDLWAITMISVPRDLYVSWSGYAGRINWVFARWHSKWWTLLSWAELLSEKMEQILWLKIPYYAVVDFQWFKDVVDTLWWVDIYVPETIHDTTYPNNNLWYETFHISAWEQHLDWDTALKYARSRHTTSDFSRSQRQQQLIKAIIDKALKKENITNINTLKELYDTYTEMVDTNITSREIIWAIKYIDNFWNVYSFWLNTYCTYKSYKLTDAWCFLYNWNRDAFNWMAVILPNWWSVSNISYYEYTKNFADFVAHNQWYLMENPKIMIRNAINKAYASWKWKQYSWRAWKLAVKMKKYWFNIQWTENNTWDVEQTTVVVYWQEYPNTIEMLKRFLPINVIQTWEVIINDCVEWDVLCEYEELPYDMELIIWNDFIDYIAENPFSFEK